MRTTTMLPATLMIAATVAMTVPFEAQATTQCVTYARDVSGLNLKGDAWRWWEAAAGVYERGSRPSEGAVLVFKRQGSMAHGHVSVVRHMKNSREVLVDHANWAPHRSPGRGKITRGVPVIDVSPNNDWTQVRVFYGPIGELGSRVYSTQGFVYRPGSQGRAAHVQTAHAQAGKEQSLPAKSQQTTTGQTMFQMPAAQAVPAVARTESLPSSQPVAHAAVRIEQIPTPPVVTPPATGPVSPIPARTAAARPAAEHSVPAAVTQATAPARMPEPPRLDVSRWAEQS